MSSLHHCVPMCEPSPSGTVLSESESQPDCAGSLSDHGVPINSAAGSSESSHLSLSVFLKYKDIASVQSFKLKSI